MEMVGMDIKTIAFIESEAEFSRAKLKGFWDVMLSRVTGRRGYLSCIADVLGTLQAPATVSLGLQDVPVQHIVGSMGRNRDFTRHFLPRLNGESSKERWRRIYTLAVTGGGFPPVELYKIGRDHYVKDGHHRISVARYLGWGTIQANVTLLLMSNCCGPDLNHPLKLCKGVEACI